MKKSYPLNRAAVWRKIRAAALHFLLSLLVFAAALYWIMQVLYPQIHSELNGVMYGLRLIAGVDLVLGPLITLLVFHPAKPLREKISDFAVVGVVQAAALVYGLHTMYQEHPKFLSYFQYGTAVTVTQREWAEQADRMPAGLAAFSRLAGVPAGLYRQDGLKSDYVPLTTAVLAEGDATVRREMSYGDDKARLAELDKAHGKLYVLAIVGKYQGAYLALNEQQQIVAVFGQRDLQ